MNQEREKMTRIKIAAGLSAADFGRLGEQVAEASAAGVDYIHLDAQDMVSHLAELALIGGPLQVKGIRPYTELPIEVHANVEGANGLLIDAWIDAGADLIILPMEHYFGHKLPFLIQRMRAKGCKFGLTVSPCAPLDLVFEAVEWVDRLVVYTREVVTNVGIRARAMDTVRRARKLLDEQGVAAELCCDGGLSIDNFAQLIDAGADVLEFSRPIFGDSRGVTTAVTELRAVIDQASK
jgi:ribulose-phosphate 3-epimerase